MKVAKISTKYFYIYFIVIYNEGERKVISNERLFDANHGAIWGWGRGFAPKWANNKQIRLKLGFVCLFLAPPA